MSNAASDAFSNFEKTIISAILKGQKMYLSKKHSDTFFANVETFIYKEEKETNYTKNTMIRARCGR